MTFAQAMRSARQTAAIKTVSAGRTEPDVGEINYSYLFRLLDELKYDGYVGCEYRPMQSTRAGLAWFYRLLDRRPATIG